MTAEEARALILRSALPAPLAEVSTRPFRELCRMAGAPITFTGMVSAKGLLADLRRSTRLLDWGKGDRPVFCQIFGPEPEPMAEAARLCKERGADGIDINMGCPVRKVISQRSGADLLRDLPRAKEVIAAVVEAARPLAVSIKTRKGWSEGDDAGLKIAEFAAELGVAFLTIHARTVEQGFSGEPDLGFLREVASGVPIPIVGNGGVKSPSDALRMLEETGCAGVMVGRGIMGDPWLLARIGAALKGLPGPPRPSLEERVSTAIWHAREIVKDMGERGVPLAKRVASWYVKGLEGAKALRRALMTARSLDEIIGILKGYASALGADVRAIGPEPRVRGAVGG